LPGFPYASGGGIAMFIDALHRDNGIQVAETG
jgi:hypothetical protein